MSFKVPEEEKPLMIAGPGDNFGQNNHSFSMIAKPEEQETDDSSFESGSYEETRRKLKYGLLTSAMMMFNITVGIGLFTLHYPLQQVGIVWGFCLNIIVCFVTTYGLVMLNNVAKMLEAEGETQERRSGAPRQQRIRSVESNFEK